MLFIKKKKRKKRCSPLVFTLKERHEKCIKLDLITVINKNKPYQRVMTLTSIPEKTSFWAIIVLNHGYALPQYLAYEACSI